MAHWVRIKPRECIKNSIYIVCGNKIPRGGFYIVNNYYFFIFVDELVSWSAVEDWLVQAVGCSALEICFSFLTVILILATIGRCAVGYNSQQK